LAKPNQVYLIYLPTGGSTDLDLSGARGEYRVQWFNPRSGGDLVAGSIGQISGGRSVSLGQPPQDASDDWLIVVVRSGS
jgi:hypothetical protein